MKYATTWLVLGIILGLAVFPIMSEAQEYYGKFPPTPAFRNVTTTTDTIEADSYADVLNLVGVGVTITGDAGTDTITFTAAGGAGAGGGIDESRYIIFLNTTDGFIKGLDTHTGSITFNGSDYVTVVEAAMNSLTAGRDWKEQVLTVGSFGVNSTISVPNYTIFSLMGNLTLYNWVNDTMIEPIAAHDPSMRGENIEIFGGTLNGNNLFQNTTSQTDTDETVHCIWINNTQNFNVHDMTLRNCFTAGLRTSDSEYGMISNIRVENPADDGIAINEGSSYVTAYGNIINGTGRTIDWGAPMGIEVQDGAHDIIVAANVISFANHSGIQIGNHVGQPPTHDVLLVSNTMSDNQFDGINIAGQVGAVISNITALNNFISGGSSSGINLSYLDRSLISGNIITDFRATAGITLGTEANYNTISNNLVTKNEDVGIYIGDTSSNNFIMGNTVQDNGKQLTSWRTGIFNRGDNTTIINNISGDTLVGAARTQLHGIYNYLTADQAIIKDNIMLNNINENLRNRGTNYLLWQNIEDYVLSNTTSAGGPFLELAGGTMTGSIDMTLGISDCCNLTMMGNSVLLGADNNTYITGSTNPNTHLMDFFAGGDHMLRITPTVGFTFINQQFNGEDCTILSDTGAKGYRQICDTITQATNGSVHAEYQLFRDLQPTTAGTILADIDMFGTNDANVTTTYSLYRTTAAQVGSTTEDGTTQFMVRTGSPSAMSTWLTLRGHNGDVLFARNLRGDGSAVLDMSNDAIIDVEEMAIGSNSVASGWKTIAIYNGTAPSGPIVSGVILYSQNVAAGNNNELHVMDENGNITVLSPHECVGDIERKASTDWFFCSENQYIGKGVAVSNYEVIRTLEELSGKTLIHEYDVPPERLRDWNTDQLDAKVRHDNNRSVMINEKAEWANEIQLLKDKLRAENNEEERGILIDMLSQAQASHDHIEIPDVYQVRPRPAYFDMAEITR